MISVLSEKVHELSKKGFLCEVVTDAWANWEFKDGRPDYNTATPLYTHKRKSSVCWRGCFFFFDKKGRLIQDDIGCFSIENGGYTRALQELIRFYDEIKDQIDPDGFNTEKILSSESNSNV